MRCNRPRDGAAAVAAALLAASFAAAAARSTVSVAGSAAYGSLPDPDRLEDRDAADLAAGSPAFTDDARRGWDAMSPAERELFRQAHRTISTLSLSRTWERLSATERGRYLTAEPGLRTRLGARWAELSPAERIAFLRRHPALARQMARTGAGTRAALRPAAVPPAAPPRAPRPSSSRTTTGHAAR